MLKKLHIHNYHSLVDFTLELGEQVLLVGSNGSGKSSVWEVLGGLVDLVTRGRSAGEVFPTAGGEGEAVPSLRRAREDLRRIGVTA